MWKTTCTGNAVANGHKWTVVEKEYGIRRRETERTRGQMVGNSRMREKGNEEGRKGEKKVEGEKEKKKKKKIPLLLEEERPVK